MKKLFTCILMLGVLLSAGFSFAGETATLLARRLGNNAEITPGKWHRNFAKAKAWAAANGVPFVAVWSNGDGCPHCVKFENCLNNSLFKTYEKDSGVVFWFGYPGDSEYQIESAQFHWTRGNKLTAYPFVRIWWPAGKVDLYTTGDNIEGYTSGSSGSKLVVNFFKSKLKNWVPVAKDLPYTIAYDVNLPPGYEAGEASNDSTKMDSVETVYTNAVVVKNDFALTGYKFIGWSLTSAGAVKYADNASVSKLSATSNATVTLYAKWAKDPYEIVLEPNYEGAEDENPEKVSVAAAYNQAVSLPSKPYVRKDCAFSGWATEPSGSVVYKDAASVKFVTDTSVTLYAKWKRTTYRTYYTGKKYTISTGLTGYAAKTTFPGMTWTSSTGKFSGTPKTANATDPETGTGLKIKFVKGKTTVYRSFVVVKDVASLEGEGMTGKTVELTTSDDDKTFTAVAVSGAMSDVKITGLPDGMEYSAADNAITGRPTKPGSYTVKVTGTSAQGQSLSATYTFEVKEGNQLVIGNFVHADKMFLNAGTELDQLLNFLNADNQPYEIAKAEVQVLDAAGNEVGQEVSTVCIDSTEGIYSLAGAISKPDTYKLVITVTSADESPAVLTQNLKLVVLSAPESEGP